jgi:hypothetical protein
MEHWIENPQVRGLYGRTGDGRPTSTGERRISGAFHVSFK